MCIDQPLQHGNNKVMAMNLQQMLEASIDPAIPYVASKIGELSRDVCIKKFKRLAKVPNVAEKAAKVAEEEFIGYRDELVEYCQDVQDDVQAGLNHVLTDFAMAIAVAVGEAFHTCEDMVPGCMSHCINLDRFVAGYFGHQKMLGQMLNLSGACECVCEEVEDLMKDFLKAELQKKNIPDELLSMLSWQITYSDKVKLPPPKSGKRHVPKMSEDDAEDAGYDARTYNELTGNDSFGP